MVLENGYFKLLFKVGDLMFEAYIFIHRDFMLKKAARTFECAKLILKSTNTFILVNKVGEKVRALRIAMNNPLLRIVETMRWRHNGRRCQCLFFDFFDSKVRRQLKSFEMFNRIF